MARRSAKIQGGDGDIDQQIREAIGSRIAELRRKRKLSARLVGEKLGISREAVTHIETGRNNITACALWKLATLFHCDFKDFFPDVPDGYGLTKIDTDKIAQEGGQKAAKWAKERSDHHDARATVRRERGRDALPLDESQLANSEITDRPSQSSADPCSAGCFNILLGLGAIASADIRGRRPGQWALRCRYSCGRCPRACYQVTAVLDSFAAIKLLLPCSDGLEERDNVLSANGARRNVFQNITPIRDVANAVRAAQIGQSHRPA